MMPRFSTSPARRFGVAAVVLAALCASSAPARAKQTKVVAYRYAHVWSAAVRMLRVDRGYKVTDKDRENGYILFVFPGSGAVKRCAGSLELVKLRSRSRGRIRLQIEIAHQPAYVELHLLDKLERKLRDEIGPPRDAPGDEQPPADEDPPAKKKPPRTEKGEEG